MNGDFIGRFIRAFDQYLGSWVGIILASTILMAWIEKMFVLIRWNPEKEMYVNQPMFPTPEWWTNPLGIVSVLVGTCLAKLGHGYWINSKYNSEQGRAPASDQGVPKIPAPPAP